jgi:DNA-binding response OmpR family regulator
MDVVGGMADADTLCGGTLGQIRRPLGSIRLVSTGRPLALAMLRILLIDPDPCAAVRLGDYLETQGHEVDYAIDARLAMCLAGPDNFHAIIVTSRPPFLDGIELCRKLRARLQKCDLLLLAGEMSVPGTVAALDAGADACLGHHTDVAEVHARLLAWQRSRRRRATGPVLRLADLEVDLNAGEARRQDKRLALSPTSFKLLHLLVEASPGIVSSHAITARLWGEGARRFDGNLRTQVYQLRCKVDRPFNAALLRTRHLGYQILAP